MLHDSATMGSGVALHATTTQGCKESEGTVSSADKAIMECATARRDAYKRVNLFRAFPGEVELLRLAAEPGGDLSGIALRQLSKLEERRRLLKSKLPEAGDISDEAIRQRLSLFLRYKEFYTLDLAHSDGAEGPRRIAEQIRQILHGFGMNDSASFYYTTNDVLSEETTGIHMSFPDLDALDENDPCLYVTSNSILAVVYSDGRENSQIGLRSEYVMSLRKIESSQEVLGAIIRSMQRANALPSWRRVLDYEKGGVPAAVARAQGDLFTRLFSMIEQKDSAIHHLYTTSYIARQTLLSDDEQSSMGAPDSLAEGVLFGHT